MTIQEQANAILARTDTDERLLRLVQDRRMLLVALRSLVEATDLADNAQDEGLGSDDVAMVSARAAIVQAERP